MRGLTAYERGRLRLQAFQMLDGWGTTNEKGVFIQNDLAKRKRVAAELIEWAIDRSPK